MPYEPFVDDPLQKLSNTAEQTDRVVAGRIPLVFSYFFGMGLMTASFQIVGTVPVDQLWL